MLLWKWKGGLQNADSISSSGPFDPRGGPLRVQSGRDLIQSPRASYLSAQWQQHLASSVFCFDSSSAEPLEGDRNLTVRLRLKCHQIMWRRGKGAVWRWLKYMSFNQRWALLQRSGASQDFSMQWGALSILKAPVFLIDMHCFSWIIV